VRSKARLLFGAPLVLIAALVLASDRPSSAQVAPEAGTITGNLPTGGGVALVQWSGGTPTQLFAVADGRGCTATAGWLSLSGSLVGYLRGAPIFVNESFVAHFPGGTLPSTPLLLVCRAVSAPAGGSVGTRSIGSCPMFPDDNPWAADISNAPPHPLSDRYIGHIMASGGNRFLHADFGENPDYGIPYMIVPAGEPSVTVTFDYASESDPGPYPIPSNVRIEAGSDRHALIVREGECRLYELFDLRRNGASWLAGSGAIFDLRSNALRPDGWTSGDAAGLPILSGLVRLDEVRAGAINHALRFTVSRTQRAYIHPATHFASSITDTSAPPMGLRLRLKADFDLSGYRGQALVVLTALKRYGMLLADNGSNWYISGATDPGWDDEDMNQLKRVPGNAFEAVDTGPLISTAR
jgi:hypothetical protein